MEATRQQLTFSPSHTIWPQQINFGPLGKECNAAGRWLTHVMHFHCVEPLLGRGVIKKLEYIFAPVTSDLLQCDLENTATAKK